MQRAILFWDTLRQWGNNFVESTMQGLKPVLHFGYETVLDGRQFERPVNYALLKITPPDGVGSMIAAAHTSLSIRAQAMARASAASRTTRRSAWRRVPAIPCISSSSSAIPSRDRPCSTCVRPSNSSSRKRALHYCKTMPLTPTAVAHPCDQSSLEGAIEAARLGLIAPILVGPRSRIEDAARAAGIDIREYPIVDAEHSHAAAVAAVQLVRESKAEALIKGGLHTDELMGAVVKGETAVCAPPDLLADLL